MMFTIHVPTSWIDNTFPVVQLGMYRALGYKDPLIIDQSATFTTAATFAIRNMTDEHLAKTATQNGIYI